MVNLDINWKVAIYTLLAGALVTSFMKEYKLIVAWLVILCVVMAIVWIASE